MNTLNYNEKIAVIRVLRDIMCADGIIDDREVALLNKVADDFDIRQYDADVEDCCFDNALAMFVHFTDAQKEAVAKLMGNMIVVDKNINYKEVNVYNSVADICDIGGPFNPDLYPF